MAVISADRLAGARDVSLIVAALSLTWLVFQVLRRMNAAFQEIRTIRTFMEDSDGG